MTWGDVLKALHAFGSKVRENPNAVTVRAAADELVSFLETVDPSLAPTPEPEPEPAEHDTEA